MILDLFKILVDEPGRLKKAGLMLCKLILNTVVANYLYTKIVGNYTLIDIRNYAAWVDSMISGRLLIGIILFGLSDLFLFVLLNAITTAPLTWLADISLEMNRREIKKLLKTMSFFKLIDIDKKANKVKVGKHTNELYDFLTAFTLKETKDEIDTLKRSFVNNLWHTYTVFVFVFYAFINITFHKSALLNTIIITYGVVLSLLYICVSMFLNFAFKHAQGFQFSIRGIQLEEIANNFIKKLPEVSSIVHNVENSRENAIQFKNTKYSIQFVYTKYPLNEFETGYYQRMQVKEGLPMLLLTNAGLNQAGSDYLAGMKHQVHVLKFEDEETLKSRIKEFFGHE